MVDGRIAELFCSLGLMSKKAQLRIVEKNPLMDADWYKGKYPDVASAGLDAAFHYLHHGWKEGRNPGPHFATGRYLLENARVCPLLCTRKNNVGACERDNPVEKKEIEQERKEIFPKENDRIDSDVFFSVVATQLGKNLERDSLEELRGILSQNYKKFEIFVPATYRDAPQCLELWNKCSEDEIPVKFVEEADGSKNGLGWLENADLEGEFVLFFEPRDSWEPDRISELNRFLRENKSSKIVINDIKITGGGISREEKVLLEERRKSFLRREKQSRKSGRTGFLIDCDEFYRGNCSGSLSALCVSGPLLKSCCLSCPDNGRLSWWIGGQVCSSGRVHFLDKKLTILRTADVGDETFAADGRDDFVQQLESLLNKRLGKVAQKKGNSEEERTRSSWEGRKKESLLERIAAFDDLKGIKICFVSSTRQAERPILDPSTRYRCFHPAEVLRSAGAFVSVVSGNAFLRNPSFDYDVYIFHRPDIKQKSLIDEIKSREKMLVADYDDLIFGESDIADQSSICKNGRLSREETERIFRDNLEILKEFEYFTVSTQNLGERIKEQGKPNVCVVHNFIPDSIFRLADAYNLRRIDKEKKLLMCCPGTLSHNLDFKVVEDALIGALRKDKGLRLCILGVLDAGSVLSKEPGIFFHKAVDYWNMFLCMRGVSFTIAPLEDTLFNDCKSNVKFLESCIVGSTLLASPIEDMERVRDAEIILPKTREDWVDAFDHIGEIDVSKNAELNYQYILKNGAKRSFVRDFSAAFEGWSER